MIVLIEIGGEVLFGYTLISNTLANGILDWLDVERASSYRKQKSGYKKKN